MGSCVCNDCPENVAKGFEGGARAAVDECSAVINISSQGIAEGIPEVPEKDCGLVGWVVVIGPLTSCEESCCSGFQNSC